MTAKQLDRIISVLERALKVAERWADVEYPERDASEAEIYRTGERPEPNSREEYAALPVEEPGRFERKL